MNFYGFNFNKFVDTVLAYHRMIESYGYTNLDGIYVFTCEEEEKFICIINNI